MRRQILQLAYPLLMKLAKSMGTHASVLRHGDTELFQNPMPALDITLNDGTVLNTSALHGKKIVFVNTASDCGYTAQYAQLQQLYEKWKDKVQVIGFPANDFKEQEKGSDTEIALFCKKNFGVSFPLAKKAVVVKSATQHPVYQWLSHKAQNGWCDKAPSWNFSKYIVDEKGLLTHYFDPSISPLSTTFLEALQE